MPDPSGGSVPGSAVPDDEPFELSSEHFELTGTDESDEPRPPSRRRRIVLASMLAVGLAGAAVLGTVAWRISSQKDATLSTPADIDGIRLRDDAEALQTAEYLRDVLMAQVRVDQAVSGVYVDSPDTERSILFFGGTTLIWTPEADLNTVFQLISDDQGAVTGVHDVEAGPLGGEMKCGVTTAEGADMAVCGWADHGSLAMALFPNRSADESAGVLLKIRNAAQKRS